MKVIAFYNLKGGVGKTAAAVNIAQLAADAGIPTLLWDLDAQGAATWYLEPEITRPGAQPKATRVVKGKTPIGRLISPTATQCLDLIPADASFRNIDLQLDKHGHDGSLSEWLNPLSEDYGLVVLDCSPALSRLAEQVLQVADRVYVPLVPTWLSMNSWEQMLAFVADRNLDKKKFVPFLSMVDRRKSLHREFLDHPPKALKRLLSGYIPYASDVERMGAHRSAVSHFAPRSPSALAYRLMWENIHRQLKL